MIDASTGELLQTIVRESRSLLQYARSAAVASRQIAPSSTSCDTWRAEQAATDAIGTFLEKRRSGLAHLGPYPSVFTDSNDAALSYMLPRIVREQKLASAVLFEADAAKVADSEALALVDRLLHLSREHLSPT
ncbi:MAG: hypothetical protein U0746_11270 [Gemmataceae bacterium]